MNSLLRIPILLFLLCSGSGLSLANARGDTPQQTEPAQQHSQQPLPSKSTATSPPDPKDTAFCHSLLSFFEQPETALKQLKSDILQLPHLFSASLTSPFKDSLSQARKQGNQWERLSSWFLQSCSLVVLLSLLLKVASLAPAYLSEIQQRWIAHIEHIVILRTTTVLFWFLKSNTPWMLVFIGSQFITSQLPTNWIILRWLAPIGTLYASFRALRIVLEWVISRTYTRSGQFVSSHTANVQASNAQTVSLVLILGLSLFLFVHQFGSPCLAHAVLFINIVLIWVSLLWFLLNHKSEVTHFFQFVSNHYRRPDPNQPYSLAWWSFPFWPLLFVCAHLMDVVISLHQRLMQLDYYRSLNIKLMRIRLEAEAKDEEDPHPNASHSERADHYQACMLKASVDAWIDTHQMERIQPPIQQWQLDKTDDNVLIITGEPGSGKTALVERLAKTWRDSDIFLLNATNKLTSPDDLFLMLQPAFPEYPIKQVDDLLQYDATGTHRVIIMDSAENLFLSEVGKLDAFRAFNQCLNAHLHHIFWVVVLNAHSWNYLSQVFNREIRFSNIHQMARWTPVETRKLILSRHQSSSLSLKYNELLLSATAGSESSSVRAANSRIFNIVWEQSSGNPEVALNLWLSASKVTRHFVEIGVPKKTDSSQLKLLQDDGCFVYTAILLHRELNTLEIMEVTHFPEPIVRHAIKQGLNIGFLCQYHNQRYRIHPLWQGALTSLLAKKNMI